MHEDPAARTTPPADPPRSDGEAPRRAASRPFVYALAVALAFGALSLGGGFLFDDWPIRATFHGLAPTGRHPLDAYRFASIPEDVQRLIERGPFPWFSSPGLRLGFFRPLGAALLLADERLFGDAAPLWHAHALAWYLALIVAAGLVLRRALRGPAFTLALVLFAANDTHAAALGWLANHHSTISVALGLFGLWAHMRAREDGWRPGRVLAPVLFGLALLAGETTFGVVAYVIAWELLGRADALDRRVRALAPVFSLSLAFLVAYKLGHYGAHDSDSYIDPIGEPLVFALAAPDRLLALIGAFFLGPPADLHLQLPSLAWLWRLIGVIALVGVAAILRRIVAGLDEADRRGQRWLVAGAALSIVPSLGAVVGSRLLIVPSLGGVAICAVILVHAWRARRGFSRKLVFGVLAFLFIARPALIMAASLGKFREYAQTLTRIARDSELPTSPDVAIVVPLAPDFVIGTYTPDVRFITDGQVPRAWWALSLAPHDHVLTRTGADRIELASVGGPMLRAPFENLFRSRKVPFHPGDEVQLKGMTVRVVEEEEGSPTKIEARFDRSLEDPTLWFVEWRDGVLKRMKPPAIGASVKLEWRKGPFGL